MNVQGSVAFVTGANRGLGLALAKELVARGAKKVYAGVRDPGSVNLPGVVAVHFDVTDQASISAAAAQCADTTLLVNNAGIARILESTLDPVYIDVSKEIIDTNYHGVVLATQAFAPVIIANGGGAIVNVLSDASWFAIPLLAAYSASKSAAWGYTNALRVEVRPQGVQVLSLHVGFMDTDMTHGVDVPKVSPQSVAAQTLDALQAGEEEILADEGTRAIKATLSTDKAHYLNPSAQ
jgi:NAD(P)-dependent dehydrogenase (short-subunit alcohol dehydrogenase family)